VNKVGLRDVSLGLIALSLIVVAIVAQVRAEEEYQVTATLQSPEPDKNAKFGYSVAVSGDIVVVGEATGNIEGYSSPGRAHIFTTDGTLLASLQSPEPSNSALFGCDVAISGDIVVVGERCADPGGINNAGRAHIFDSDGNHIAILQAPEPDANKLFSISVDIEGEIVVVGECKERLRVGGEAFIFDTDGNYITTLQDPEPQIASGFGYSVAVSGDIIVVSALSAKVEGVESAGKVYIFDYEGNLVATLQSPEPQEFVYFGISLDVSGDIVLVDECNAKVEGKDNAGRAYIYDSEGNYKATLQAPDPEKNAEFGHRVAVSGDILVVGESLRNGETFDEGRVYIFDSDGGLIAILQSPEPYPGVEFGYSVAVSEDIVAVGELDANVEGTDMAGRVYIFQAGAAAFTSSGLNIDPSSVDVGGMVTISVEVTNTGAKSGTHTVALMIDGEVEDEKTVILNPDESETVSFQVSAAEQGSYSVEVDGLSGSYTVAETKVEPSFWDRIPGFPYEAIILGCVTGAFMLWLIQRKQ